MVSGLRIKSSHLAFSFSSALLVHFFPELYAASVAGACAEVVSPILRPSASRPPDDEVEEEDGVRREEESSDLLRGCFCPTGVDTVDVVAASCSASARVVSIKTRKFVGTMSGWYTQGRSAMVETRVHVPSGNPTSYCNTHTHTHTQREWCRSLLSTNTHPHYSSGQLSPSGKVSEAWSEGTRVDGSTNDGAGQSSGWVRISLCACQRDRCAGDRCRRMWCAHALHLTGLHMNSRATT